MLLRPDVPPRVDWSWLPLLTGYAVQAALADRLPDIALKWPNDVLVDGAPDRPQGRRHPGRADRDPRGPVAVVGVGINVDQTLDELPVALATSVELETGEPVERTGLLGQVLGSLHGLQGLLDDPESLRTAYADVCVDARARRSTSTCPRATYAAARRSTSTRAGRWWSGPTRARSPWPPATWCTCALPDRREAPC